MSDAVVLLLSLAGLAYLILLPCLVNSSREVHHLRSTFDKLAHILKLR